MKRLFLFFSICIMYTSVLSAQEDQVPFLFPDFNDAFITFRDGQQFTASVNFSLITNTFVFVDTSDNDEVKEIQDRHLIASIKMGGRTFGVNKEGNFQEILQPEKPKILVEYKGKLIDRGSKAAFGGRTQTSNIDNVNKLSSGGQTVQLKGDGRWKVSDIRQIYSVEYNGKFKNFSNEKQFLKIYSGHKVELAEYIKQNSINFKDIYEIVDLCNYADTLD